MQREKPILYLLTHVTNKLFCLGGGFRRKLLLQINLVIIYFLLVEAIFLKYLCHNSSFWSEKKESLYRRICYSWKYKSYRTSKFSVLKIRIFFNLWVFFSIIIKYRISKNTLLYYVWIFTTLITLENYWIKAFSFVYITQL